MPSCFLHVGVSKTGTTAIQGFLDRRRDLLRARGLDLPLLGYESVVEAGRALAMELRRETDPAAPLTDSWRRLDRYIAGAAGDFCISRESLSHSLSRRAGADFATSFFARRGVTLKVTAFVRDPVDFVNSAYVQNAKRLRLSKPFEEWVEAAMAANDPRFSLWLMFRHVIGSPDAELIVRPFNQSGKRPPEDFLDAIGHGDFDASSFEDAPFRNASPGPRAVAAGLAIGRALAPKNLSPAELVRYGEVFEAALAARGWAEQPFYGPDPALAGRIAAHFGPGNDAFARAVWDAPWNVQVPRRLRERNALPHAQSRADVADLARETLARGRRRELWRNALSVARWPAQTA